MARVPFKKIAKSLTGISTPVFGVSWNPPETDREIARKLMVFLEDRRALYSPFDYEMPDYVSRSIIEIRHELTDVLKKLDEGSQLVEYVRAMRAACRQFLDQAPVRRRFGGFGGDLEFFTALGKLRALLGIHIAQICVSYGVNVEEELAAVLPSPDDTTAPARPKVPRRRRSVGDK